MIHGDRAQKNLIEPILAVQFLAAPIAEKGIALVGRTAVLAELALGRLALLSCWLLLLVTPGKLCSAFPTELRIPLVLRPAPLTVFGRLDIWTAGAAGLF